MILFYDYLCSIVQKNLFFFQKHFKYCNLLVIIQSTIDAFNERMGVRDTWMQYITQRRVENVSAVFLLGNEKYGENITQVTR